MLHIRDPGRARRLRRLLSAPAPAVCDRCRGEPGARPVILSAKGGRQPDRHEFLLCSRCGDAFTSWLTAPGVAPSAAPGQI